MTAAELGKVAHELEAERRRLKRRKNETDLQLQRRKMISAAKALETRGSKGYTLLRKHYDEFTIPVQYFRWLVKKRGLKDYRIKHFISYPGKLYLSDFLKTILQKRHDLSKAGLKSSVMGAAFKLFINSYYGYLASFSFYY